MVTIAHPYVGYNTCMPTNNSTAAVPAKATASSYDAWVAERLFAIRQGIVEYSHCSGCKACRSCKAMTALEELERSL